MNQIERYCDRELQEMQEICKEVCIKTNFIPLKEINTIALIEINRELNERKIRKEIDFNDKRELLKFCDKEGV